MFIIKLTCHILRDIDIDLLQNQLFVFDIFIFLYVVFVRCIILDTIFFIFHKVYHLIVNNMINNEILLGIKKFNYSSVIYNESNNKVNNYLVLMEDT